MALICVSLTAAFDGALIRASLTPISRLAGRSGSSAISQRLVSEHIPSGRFAGVREVRAARASAPAP